ncbi:Serine/threonine protein kinase [Phytophthora megakarya]|uniref:Serine/threonine protein kinase n=1 Tax=Phytophthora megakarya TaxID=4795 RepID=A0A225WYF5_9STRA|nr:Serine/threonine protein kinase [Phytophthora megakarya]
MSSINVLHLVVPGAGPIPQALTTARDLCTKMEEIRAACENLHIRLYNLYSELEFMQKKNQVLSADSLKKFTLVVTKFLQFLRKNCSKTVIHRIVQQNVIFHTLKNLHEAVSELVFELLDVAVVDQWREDRCVLETVFATAISDNSILQHCQSARAQLEAILTLKFELERRAYRHNDENMARMKLLMMNIQKSFRVSVGPLPTWFLPDYEVEFEPQPFAKGSIGSLHRGKLSCGTSVVMKCFNVDDMRVDNCTARQLEKDMDLLFQMEHISVVKALGASHVSARPVLVYEDAVNGDLGSFLSLSDANKQKMSKLLYQASLGLAYIHNKGVVHGHLKLSNILVGADGQAKLSGFCLGTFRRISKPNTESSTYLRWRAPECLKRRPTFASDVYSFAMCMIEAAAGEAPFAYLDDDDVRESLKAGEIPEQPDEMNDELWELVVAMTNADPSKRIGLNQVIDKLKSFSEINVIVPDRNEPFRCRVCAALILDNSRCCTQCVDQMNVNATSPPNYDSTQHNESPRSSSKLNVSTPISELLGVLRNGSDNEQEDAVLLLIQACINDSKRQQVCVSHGVSDLVDLTKNGRTHFLKVCAIGCLNWLSELDAALSDETFENLQDTVRAATGSECVSVVQSLQDTSSTDKLKTVIYCTCAAEANGRTQLRDAGVVTPLVKLLSHENATLTIWTMDALGNLASDEDAKRAIVSEGAIPALMKLLRMGTEIQRGFASYVLGQLSTQDISNSSTIVNSGAIPYLVDLLRTRTNIPKNFAAYALGCIAGNNDEYGLAISEVGGVEHLVRLIRNGTNVQKAHAATALGWLANQSQLRAAITQKGVIPDLIALVRRGTDDQKENSAFALSFLATDISSGAAMVNDGVIVPMLALFRGSENQKEYAVCTLANLAGSQDICLKIADAGGIRPLVTLLRTGSNDQKGMAAYSLGCIATTNETNRLKILSDEVIELLVELIRGGTTVEKDQAMFALCYLTKHGHSDTRAIASEAVISQILPFLRAGKDEQKHFVATALGRLANDATNKRIIASCGAISLLVDLLKSGNAANKEQAAIALGRLATNNVANTDQMKREGVVDLLQAFRRLGNRQQKRSAAVTLSNIGENGASVTKTRRR